MRNELALSSMALTALIAFSARAETASAPNDAAASPGPATTSATPAATAPAPPPLAAMSQSKFLGALYAEIARHTPNKSPAGPGEVAASFHVNAKGKVDKVVIEKTTSEALAKAVKKILAEVQAPPPPGGEFDASQGFRFH